jgi:aryl-alcohol dehydrogenase-like predicted oxidoreductase
MAKIGFLGLGEMSNALKGIREEIVLATKVRLPMSENFNRSGSKGTEKGARTAPSRSPQDSIRRGRP